ncbi:MAG: helix-turn-helix transcriptional regulator [Rhodobacteraceae bacterium]|nr:helix-turn-helix transcriptional regulator [Paracoccaceae bacterium]
MRKSLKLYAVQAAFLIQLLSLILFVGEYLVVTIGIIDLRISWEVHETVEIMAMIGLTTGLVLGTSLIRNLLRRNSRIEEQLRVASGDFHALLHEEFKRWRLSRSEKDVAYFAVKGLSNSEISALRGTSEGTIKAQLNAVYKKSGLESRAQLLGYFIEELMATDAGDSAMPTPESKT